MTTASAFRDASGPVNFSASWRGSGSARWRSDGPDEQWPSGSPRFARRPGDLARLFPDVLMGGRLFPTGNERELGVDTDDRSSSGASVRCALDQTIARR
jgi:hypothetical protein